MTWKTKKYGNIKVKNPILIEGLPGMGNVGKIAIDFLIDELDAKKVYDISSHELPHCVFINEHNIVELPMIQVFHKKIGKSDFLFLSGDLQPVSETSCYSFCNYVLDSFEKNKCNEIITLGGIALGEVPEEPKVYCTGNSKELIKNYQKYTSKKSLHNFIGPIVGVSGLLLGLASKRNIPAVTLLAETYGHPTYIGIHGAQKIVSVLKKKFNFKVDASKLQEDISAVKKITKKQSIKNKKLQKKESKKIEDFIDIEDDEGINYIG